MSATTQAHTLQEYLDQATPMLMEILGLPELLYADGNSYDRLAEKYPDAVFTLIAMNNLFHHDREFSEIHQEAFSSILAGEDIPSVQFRHNRRMDAYTCEKRRGLTGCAGASGAWLPWVFTSLKSKTACRDARFFILG